MISERLETVEINGAIEIGGVRVAAGDLVVADGTEGNQIHSDPFFGKADALGAPCVDNVNT